MEFIKGYMDDAKYRHLLNEMTGEIFGFSFENWYLAGYFEGEYVPYSYIENGKLIANASANIMKFAYNGEEKTFIQIGTVMTHPDFRNKGLARSLIERILNDFSKKVDGFYLFGNLNAIGFYERIGFKHLNQWRWSLEHLSKPDKTHFHPVEKGQCDHYTRMLKQAVNIAEFDHNNRSSLQMFYTFNLENVYYCHELDCYTVMYVKDRTLYLDSIVSKNELEIYEVISRIAGEFERIIFGFTPKYKLGLHAELYDGEDDYRLFYLGTQLECVEKNKLYFPVMSHA